MALASVVVAALVDVAVINFLRGGCANFANGDIEVKVLPRERVVAIDHHIGVIDRANGKHLRAAVWHLRLKHGTGSNFGISRELRAGDFFEELFIDLAVSLGSRNFDLEVIADRLAVEFALESLNDVPMSVEISEWLAAFAAVDDLSVVIRE